MTKNHDEIRDIMDKLSVMFITKNSDPNFLTHRQKKFFRSLFGDYATRTYKDKIKKLEKQMHKSKKVSENHSS